MAKHDPKRYYALLNVSPGASDVEIRLAYKFLKQAHKDGKKVSDIGRIREAYTTLSDRDSRARYDGATKRAAGPSRLGSTWAALSVAVVFAVTIGLVFGSQLTAPFVSFDRGDKLYWKSTRKPLGTVLEYEESHEFPEAPTQAAYRIQFGSGEVRWFGAADLHRNGTRR